MEQVIKSVATALGVGATLDQIHDSMLEQGWSEDDIFLAIKAGEIIYQGRVAMEEEKKIKFLRLGENNVWKK